MPREPSDILDELLVLGAQAGRHEDLARLIARWDERLRRHATHLLGDPHSGADASQEAWLKIVKRIRTLRDPAAFGAWSGRIVTNVCRDARRRRERASPGSGGLGSVRAPERCEAGEGAPTDRLRSALSRLPPEQRALVSLRYADRHGLREISRVLGVPVGTVKSRLSAARAELRCAVDREDSPGH